MSFDPTHAKQTCVMIFGYFFFFFGHPSSFFSFFSFFSLSPFLLQQTETFRGELSMDEVQKIYKLYKPQLITIFMYYAVEHPAKPGQPPMEPSMDGPKWLQMMKDSKLVTRKSDVPNDLPELNAREIFNNVQAEEEEDGGGDVGGGADEMIYMEYLEAWGAVACFKRVNPYVPLWKRMEETFVDKLFPPQKNYALKPV